MHDSVSKHLSDTDSTIFKLAQSEFFCWVHKLTKFPKQHLHIRFIAADATALGHTLQHTSVVPGATTANVSAYSWTFRKLDVELTGGLLKNPGTPVLFDVIDTSDLCDLLGFLNMICAYIPLLALRITSTICTELLNYKFDDTSQSQGPGEKELRHNVPFAWGRERRIVDERSYRGRAE